MVLAWWNGYIEELTKQLGGWLSKIVGNRRAKTIVLGKPRVIVELIILMKITLPKTNIAIENPPF